MKDDTTRAIDEFRVTVIVMALVIVVSMAMFCFVLLSLVPEVVAESAQKAAYNGANQAFKDSVESVNTQ